MSKIRMIKENDLFSWEVGRVYQFYQLRGRTDDGVPLGVWRYEAVDNTMDDFVATERPDFWLIEKGYAEWVEDKPELKEVKPEGRHCVRCGMLEEDIRSSGRGGGCSVYGKGYGNHSYVEAEDKLEKIDNINPRDFHDENLRGHEEGMTEILAIKVRDIIDVVNKLIEMIDDKENKY